MKVNHLPVLTWNKSDFNEVKLPMPTTDAGGSGLQPVTLPAGVRLFDAGSDAVEAMVAAAGGRPAREAVVAGKSAMYLEQDFPTGMGAETDALYAEQGIAARMLEIREQTQIQEPIRLDYVYADGTVALESLYIHAGRYSEVTVIEYFRPSSEPEVSMGYVGSQTRVIMEEGARVHLVKVQRLPKGFLFFDDMGARLQRSADYGYTQVELGAARAYVGAYVDQWGDASVFRSDMGYLGSRGSSLDINYVDVYRGRKTRGKMYFQGVLTEDAQKVSRETLDFRQGCTGAEGEEAENVLALGADIVNKADPMILGEEEDVSGQHAVTVGRLSAEMLYYMQTRGISEETAQELMVRASVQRVSDRVPDEMIRQDVGRYLDKVFCRKPGCENYCTV